MIGGELAKAHIDVMSHAAENENNAMGNWMVVRQDDNGNRFVVATGLTRQEAERLVAQYESLGHKQMYWAEQEGK